MLKVIIFDLDGTLVNAYPAVVRSVNHALTQLGFPKKSPAFIKASVGWGDRHLMAGFVGEKLADKAIKLYRPHHAKALQEKGGVKFLAGALGLLKSLKANGFQLAIATNRPSRFTHIILKTLKSRELFDLVLCADKAARPKPYPDMLLNIAQRLKVKRGEALYVGDMTIDVLTGRNARIDTIAVTGGSSSLKELKALKPRQIIARIDALNNTINKINRSTYE